MVNQDKLEASSNSLDLETIDIKKIHQNFWGSLYLQHWVYFFYKLNFESTEKSLTEMFKGWGWRGLTIIDKIQVMKSFALPKIL